MSPPPPPQAAVRRLAPGQRPARPAQAAAGDQLGLHRVGRGAARRRALDEAAGGRDQRLHPRGARERRRPAAGDPRPRQGRDPHGGRGRPHRDPEFDRRARVRLRGRRRPRPQARRAHPLTRAASAPDRGPRGTRRIARGHQVDLAPRETKARRRDGTLFDAELGVSKVKLDRREVYIVCLRDTSDRKRAEAAIRESEARYRTLVENAPEAIVVLDVDLGRFVECNDNAVRFFKMSREELLASGPEQDQPAGAGRRHAVVRRRPRLHRPRARRRGAVLRVAAPRRARPRDSLRSAPGAAALLRRAASSAAASPTSPSASGPSSSPWASGACSSASPATWTCRHARGDRRDGRARHAGRAVRGDPVRRGRPTRCSQVAGRRLPHALPARARDVEVGSRNGSCAAAVYLQRQVIVAEIAPRRAVGEPARARRSPPACAPAGPRRSAPPTAACSARSRSTSTSRAARCAATSS